ncbi:hypothetical protein [Paenibacillus radicis (ex Xue et al. 2023)]|uniref:Uncharacterized protein n=1 Tax=Paenibacillus radicis (ex Xue et al. 2023) TaxID=2972489 RepID=A0ABT1YLI4_9BACL|nr:hypothetical protein [Paenibacillus radicis (ex Xue et al. 2023)]MCR8634043.1 hypothetical protein [Paenibacillus radicis (ex Xue et al. 2023)]
MIKSIQAYFRTENEAEDVRILLQKYDTEMLEIGVIQEDGMSGNSELVVPLGAGIAPSGTGGSGAIVYAESSGEYAPLLGVSLDGEDDELERFHYVLAVQVNEKDYDEVVSLIQNNQGHISTTDSE